MNTPQLGIRLLSQAQGAKEPDDLTPVVTAVFTEMIHPSATTVVATRGVTLEV